MAATFGVSFAKEVDAIPAENHHNPSEGMGFLHAVLGSFVPDPDEGVLN